MTDISSANISQRCGHVCILGLPNAGKSTLVNTLVGSKVSIVSSKAQTTRSRVLGIALHGDAQLILLDTPGVFAPKKTLERAMVAAAFDAIDGADVVVHLIDATRKNSVRDAHTIQKRLGDPARSFLVLNKVDLVKKPDLLALATALNADFPYASTFMISGLKASGTDTLADALAERMPQAEWMFPEDQITDMPMRLMAAEIVREKVFRQLHEELPYAIMVVPEQWENFENGSVKIGCAILVQKDSQKAIVVGKGGSRIKAIGQAAREELEQIMGGRVHLTLFVKVEENWAERSDNYPYIGLDFPG